MSAKQTPIFAAEHVDAVPGPDADALSSIENSREAVNGDGIHSLNTLI